MQEVNDVTWMTRTMLDVSLNPDPSQLPGGGTLADLTNGLAGFVLILALFGLVVCAGGWGLGVATSNMSWAERGKSGTIVCALAALHESSALTHLQDARGAWRAQERALHLTPEYDYTDRALTQLDRSTCLVYEGDAGAAAENAMRALAPLTKEHRRGIILMRAQNIIRALPAHEQARPEVSDLRDLVADSSSGGDE